MKDKKSSSVLFEIVQEPLPHFEVRSRWRYSRCKAARCILQRPGSNILIQIYDNPFVVSSDIAFSRENFTVLITHLVFIPFLIEIVQIT